MAYRYYLTDALKCIAENTAVHGGKYIKARYYDIVNKVKEPEEKRTKEEIISNISDKLRGLSDG